MVGKSSERQDSLKRTRDRGFMLGRILHKLLEHSLGTGVIGAGRSGATHIALTRYPNIIYHTIRLARVQFRCKACRMCRESK